MGFFGTPTPDPLGGLLRTNYNAGDQQWEGAMEALKAASYGLLHPEQGSGGGGWAGAIGDIGGAMSSAGTAYKKGKTDYLATALAKEQAQRKIEADNLAQQQAAERDQALADMVAGLPPDQRKMLQGNPELAQKFGEEWAEAQFADAKARSSGSSNHYGAGQPGVGMYEGYWVQPDLAGGPPLISKLPEDIMTNIDPRLKEKQAKATEGGKVHGKTEAEIYWEDLHFATTASARIGAIDTAIAGADRFAGMSFDSFMERGGNPQEWHNWRATLASVKATATAAILDEAKLYPMSEGDREFVTSMANQGLDEWRSPADVKRLLGILRDSSMNRLHRIEEGKSATMPNIGEIIKKFDIPATVSPPEYEWRRNPTTGVMERVKITK